MVAGCAYSIKACYQQALQHQPGISSACYSPGLEGGGLVAETAYS